jgi:hypothetical protein
MRTLSVTLLLSLLALTLSAAPSTAPQSDAPRSDPKAPPIPAIMAPDNFDFKELLGAPPADGSEQQKAESEKMLVLQSHRSPEEMARCVKEVTANAFTFGQDIVGREFIAKDFPQTRALLSDSSRQVGPVITAAKLRWNRPRPYKTDPRIKPCVRFEKSTSYPSGHAAGSTVWSLILAELYPDHRDAILARGKEFGVDRTLGGVHYPSDVAAGQKLGAEMFRRLMSEPQFKAELEKAKAECMATARR